MITARIIVRDPKQQITEIMEFQGSVNEDDPESVHRLLRRKGVYCSIAQALFTGGTVHIERKQQ